MNKILLKKLISPQNRNIYVILLTGIFMAIYTVSGAISNQNAVTLAMPSFERSIPFLPWTIWIYIGLYPLYLIWAVFGYKDELEFNKTLYAFMLIMFISCGIFIAFPVTYPRSYFPLGPDNDLTTLVFRAVRSVDKPSNCLPSLHVGLCYLFAFGYFKESKMKFWISILISTLIALSTLTTKQHYIYDLVAGFLLACGLWLFFRKFTTIKA